MGIIQALFRQEPTRPKPSQYSGMPLLWGLLGGSAHSKTGLVIDEETSLSSSAVWSAVTQLSQSVAGLPLHLYRRLQPRGKERYPTHPCYSLLHLAPNDEMTAMSYREAMMGQVLLTGFCVSEIQRNTSGDIQALWPLFSSRTKMGRTTSGELHYVYRLADGEEKIFRKDQILRVIGFSPNGLLGYNPIHKLTESVALGLSLEEYQARFFSNGAVPRAVLEHPEVLSPEARDNLEKSWEGAYGGLSRSNRVGILEEGMKLNVFGVSPADAQALDGRVFQLQEVARIFNMPPHMLKDLSKSSFSNIEQQSLEFVKYTLRPWLVRFEQAYNTQLLRPVQQNKLFFEHLLDGLLRGDSTARHSSYVSGRNWGYYSANDIREFENMNPLPGKEGDMYLVPLNMVPADQAANPPEPPPAVKEVVPEADEETPMEETKAFFKQENRASSVAGMKQLERSYRRLFNDAVQRIVNKEAAAVKKAAKSHLEGRSAKTFESWVEDFYTTMPDYIKKNFFPTQHTFMRQITQEAMRVAGIDPLTDMSAQMDKWATDFADVYTKRYVSSSKGQLKKIVENTDPENVAAAISQRADEWIEKRAGKAALNETVRISNFTALQVWKESGVRKKVWVTVGKNCAFCDSLDGKVVGIESSFLDDLNDKGLMYITKEGKPTSENTGKVFARGPTLHCPLHQGCDCSIMPA